ncbi:hypothetical protein EON80_19405 [bacterium]|nr:MAG: hypothetical protein EON80_19405 [bacterium]
MNTEQLEALEELRVARDNIPSQPNWQVGLSWASSFFLLASAFIQDVIPPTPDFVRGALLLPLIAHIVIDVAYIKRTKVERAASRKAFEKCQKLGIALDDLRVKRSTPSLEKVV